MKKNILGAITLIALVIGAFGLTFGYLAVTKPDSTNPLIFLSQIPKAEEGNGQTPQSSETETIYVEEIVIQDNQYQIYKISKIWSIENRTRLDWMWVMTNTSEVHHGNVKIYMNFTISGVNNSGEYGTINIDNYNWDRRSWNDFYIPNKTGNTFNLGIYNQAKNSTDGEISIDIIAIIQYTVF